MRKPLLFMSFLLLCLGCEAPIEVGEEVPILTEEGESLLHELAGNWRVEGIQTSTCPPEWTTSFPQGETRWSEEEGQLTIEDLDGNAPNLHFWPIDGTTMELSMSITQGDCMGSEGLTLEFIQETGNTLQGVFTSHVDVEFGNLCPLPNPDDFPCNTQFTWQAIRR